MNTPIDCCLCNFCGKSKRSSVLCSCGEKSLNKFNSNFIDSQIPIDPEINRIINNHFWDLLES